MEFIEHSCTYLNRLIITEKKIREAMVIMQVLREYRRLYISKNPESEIQKNGVDRRKFSCKIIY